MVAPAQGETFDSDRILMALATHQVEFVVVGGIAARAHGASRATADFDCIPANDIENLDRLAKALTVLNARLRVAGMSVRIASLRDIVESKEFASRPKDFEALPELRDLLARQDP